MHVVAISSWKEETEKLIQALAGALGITAYEARQRMIGGGPAVVASFADPLLARALVKKLNQCGIDTLVVDATAVRSGTGRFIVRRFALGAWSLRIETTDGQRAEIPCEEIDLILQLTSIVGTYETKTVTERKLNIGMTVLSGGIPITKKTNRREEVSTEEREKVMYLYAGRRPPFVFSQNSMSYEGLGSAMKLSRELNFSHLMNELRRLCPGAVYDDRLLNRPGQVRLLGPALNPETNLDLAAEILARSLRVERPGSSW